MLPRCARVLQGLVGRHHAKSSRERSGQGERHPLACHLASHRGHTHTVKLFKQCEPLQGILVQVKCEYHLLQNKYSFDALQAYCFGINLKL